MKMKSKLFALAGVTLLSASVLAACGANGGGSAASNRETVYSYVYTSDPESLDYTLVNKASTGDIVANLVDGLIENDKYGNFVPSLAEDWTVSKDGKTYTFTLREDAKWFTADGEEYGAITAEDFVTGLKHAADKKSEALYVVQDTIAGLKDYVDGKSTDFSTVGIKALDDKTIEYTLAKPEPYFLSKLTMGILFPINAEFLASQGDNFGAAKPDSILYSGPYLLSAMTAKSSIEFVKNPEYWDADKVNVEEVKWVYYDGQDPESLAKGFLDGNYTVGRLFPNSASYPKIKEEHGEDISFAPQNDVSYFFMPNLGRTNYTNTSKTDDAQKESTRKALLNKDFRQALAFAINGENFSAQSNGVDAAKQSLRNLQVPTEFASADGKNFAELTAGFLTGDEWKNVDLTDAQDGIFNADKAKAEFEKAKKALEADGVKFPIRLDVLSDQADEINGQRYASLKESIESVLGAENVVIDIQKVGTDEYETATYYATSADQADFDFSLGGWGPDYADPSTYLDIFKSVGSPYATRFGLTDGKSDDLLKAVDWAEFDKLVDEANAESSDLAARYTKYAKAQAWLLDSGLARTVISQGGTPRFTKVVPFTVPAGNIGIKGVTYFKGVEIQDKPVTGKEYEAAKAKWQEEKAKSNAEYQETLQKKVK